jgi:hypothetical protein
MDQHRSLSAYLPFVPWCCLTTLLILFTSSLVFLQPLADAASFIVLAAWVFLFVQLSFVIRNQYPLRSLQFPATACVMATTMHVVMLQATGQDCVLTRGLRYVYWQAFISPDALFPCNGCIG